jgi:crotonobetainyl-CoA:carnitine CoA-transferase CaiB-like acyl-CoA transferase
MTAENGPLAGVRVLDFSRLLAGAGGTRVLANYGAEVIRVEWPHYPAADYLRFSVLQGRAERRQQQRFLQQHQPG